MVVSLSRTSPLAIALLMFVALAASGDSARKTVSVDLSSLDAETFAKVNGAEIQKQALLRFVQNGFAVVAPGNEATIALALGRVDEVLLLSLECGGKLEQRALVLNEDPGEAIHLEVVHKLVNLAEACQLPAPAPTKPAVTEPRVSEPVVAAPKPPAPRSEPFLRSVAAAVSTGAQWRHGRMDPRLGILVEAGRGEGLNLQAEVAFVPANNAAIGVFEGEVSVGPSYVVGVTPWVALGASIRAGARAHRWSMEAGTRGNEWDWLARASFSAQLRWSRHLVVSPFIAPGVTSRAQVHRRGEETLWNSGPLRLETGILLGARFF